MPAARAKILILGGTAEASQLSGMLSTLPVDAISSLAGRTKNPTLPHGKVRIGGFGGVEGLIDYIKVQKIDLIIDATHPYAFTMSHHAIAATKAAGVSLLRLERPRWKAEAGDKWIDVENEAEAALKILPQERVLLALGRQHIAPFATRHDVHFIMRMIDAPEVPLPRHCDIILAKPGDEESEKRFLMESHIGLIVCRNSGGAPSYAKIRAARALQLPVMMIARPPYQGAECVDSVDDAFAFIRSHFAL